MSAQLNPYLSFRDDAREAMEFYQSVFGGELASNTFAEFQASDDPAEQDMIMHSMLTTKGGMVLMASDTPKQMDYTPGNSCSLSLSGEDERELRGYWEKLSGGQRHHAAGSRSLGRHVRHVHRQVRRQLAGQHRRAGHAGRSAQHLSRSTRGRRTSCAASAPSVRRGRHSPSGSSTSPT